MRASLDDTILNIGLDLAMEFGADWLQPIQKRLLEKFPDLTMKEADQYNSVCRTAMKTGHEFVYKKLETAMKGKTIIQQKDLAIELKTTLTKKYPWINSENYSKLLSQGIYYAYKDGLHNALASD